MALTSAGLNDIGMGAGRTENFQVQYEDTLANQDIVKRNANALLAVIEGEFAATTAWFNTPAGKFGPSKRQIVNFNLAATATSFPGANNTGYGGAINLDAQNNTPDAARAAARVGMVFINEWVEVLMDLTNGRWSRFNSMGEGLSQYCGIVRFLSGHYDYYGSFVDGWLNNHPRQDWVSTTENVDGNGVSYGCALAFIYFLNTQLSFSINDIIAAGASTLEAVYDTLTGDSGNPYPFFAGLLEHAYPSSATAAIPVPVKDNPFPLARLSFWVDKSTFGRDEVQDVINTNGGRFENAFWLVLEGFSKNSYLSIAPTISAFTGSFKTGIAGIGIEPTLNMADRIVYENENNPKIPQRIRLAYDIIFTAASLTSLGGFPAAGADAVQMELDTSVTIGGNTVPGSAASTMFELVSGADPYFTNINPQKGNTFWLSQDLRVFTVTPGINSAPFGPVAAGKPVLNTADPTNLDTGAGFQYAQSLITYLNSNFSNSDPSVTDPLDSLPGQGVAFSDASSVARYTFDPSTPIFPARYQNYHFAIARVRLRGVPGSSQPANNVKVFFRLWKTQTPDTNFSSADYPSNLNAGNHPETPLPGTNNETIPFFATGNYAANNDYAGQDKNNRKIQLGTGDSVWAYYVCYLNLFDSTNVVNGESVSNNWAVGTHHCLVAEIAYEQAPILNASIAKNPENCDKLAQRNLQLTYSDNPGIPATHRIPQTFDIKPSFTLPGLSGISDELMIDWGGVPVGSIANIYWPQVSSAEVLALANSMYGAHFLTATDSHTIQTKVTQGVTYIPVPTGSGENFAGLFTVDLPTTVVAGQEFNILVRKISTHARRIATKTEVLLKTQRSSHSAKSNIDSVPQQPVSAATVAPENSYMNWRYVTGTFQVRIPVTTKETMLLPEENTLAIMKARLQAMSPANRWYPVLQRYILYISARIDGLGGDSASIKPSFNGVLPAKPSEGAAPAPSCKHECCRAPQRPDESTCCKWVIWALGTMVFLFFILTLILILKK
jgi:hypothetical protein